ncbi:MAG: hypothetical protein AAGE84_24450 [Cyanobacteria bacterium P01_G01_bin.39]
MDLVVIFLWLIAIASIYLFYQQVKKQRRKPKLDRSRDQELLRLLGGDKQTALRLLRNARKNNPGRSYLWYHEKVIYDLERDRRY